ncbi:MAG: hypothetical protein K8R17_07115 [Methanosarcinales archaeon]|jgi:hypothetical protein|nr:hypothetical protein [Methanosarcinales archaeon]
MSQKEFFKKELIKELRLVEALMKKEEDLDKKIYYFSAAYGITNRTYRYSFSKDVLLADLVLNNGYQTLLDRAQRIKAGDRSVLLEEIHFKKIEEGLRQLADAFEKDESILEPLENILTAVFSTSGAGNYIRGKGLLKL